LHETNVNRPILSPTCTSVALISSFYFRFLEVFLNCKPLEQKADTYKRTVAVRPDIREIHGAKFFTVFDV